jgi:hypothetical protein
MVEEHKSADGRICNYVRPHSLESVYLLNKVLLLQLAVAVHEAVHATCCIDELALAGVERVRAAGNFDLNHWVSLAFKLYCICSLACRLCKEHIAVGHVLEHDGAIVFWMNTFFHFNLV